MATDTQREIITVRSPATGEVLGEAPVAGPDEVREAVARARAAQAAWGDLPVRERCRRIQAFRKAIVARADEIALRLARETGKPRQEALVLEVLGVATLAAYFGRRATEILRPRAIDTFILKHRRSYVHYRPKGVVAVIAPWNFPFLLPLCDAVMALIAGNAVVIKPSDVTPLIALEAKAIWDGSGLPADLLQVVPGGAITGQALIDAAPDHVVFTGSVASGRKVAVACAGRLIPCSLELGGKAPAIVCADAGVERTARALVWGAFANAGQVCASVERVYAVGSVYEPLVRRVVELTRDLRQGDPAAGEVEVGSLTFPLQIEIVDEQVRDALALGAKAETGGQRAPGPGLFFGPTVLTGVTPEMRVMREETFGPVLPIMPVASEEEALRLANDSHLGLGAYVFSGDVPRALRLAERIEAGSVMVNDVILMAGAAEMPWGGVKQSGLGRVRSDVGLLELVHLHHVNYPRIPLPRELWWYPYRESFYRLVSAALRRLFG